MKRTMMLLLMLLSLQRAQAGDRPGSLLVVFWNLENFFDYKSDARQQYWTSRRFQAKCEGVCKTLLLIADRYGQFPDIVGFAEVENRAVVSRLLRNTLLRKAGYGIVHYDSPDRRGIDCALIHRPPLVLESGSARHLYDSTGAVMHTRDILLASFGELCVLVNHHPSKLGSGKGAARDVAMERMLFLADSLLNAGAAGVLAVGDFLFQQKCEKRMKELMAGGTTVILVSHSIEQIERMCSKVAWLSHGHLKMNGDTATVCAAYKATQRGEA